MLSTTHSGNCLSCTSSAYPSVNDWWLFVCAILNVCVYGSDPVVATFPKDANNSSQIAFAYTFISSDPSAHFFVTWLSKASSITPIALSSSIVFTFSSQSKLPFGTRIAGVTAVPLVVSFARPTHIFFPIKLSTIFFLNIK